MKEVDGMEITKPNQQSGMRGNRSMSGRSDSCAKGMRQARRGWCPNNYGRCEEIFRNGGVVPVPRGFSLEFPGITNLFNDILNDNRPLWKIPECEIPSYNLYYNDDQFLVLLCIPGADANSFQIELEEGTLNINYKQKQLVNREQWKEYIITERGPNKTLNPRTGQISLQLFDEVPVIPESAQATYDDGVLTIVIDKKKKAKLAHKIALQSAEHYKCKEITDSGRESPML